MCRPHKALLKWWVRQSSTMSGWETSSPWGCIRDHRRGRGSKGGMETSRQRDARQWLYRWANSSLRQERNGDWGKPRVCASSHHALSGRFDTWTTQMRRDGSKSVWNGHTGAPPIQHTHVGPPNVPQKERPLKPRPHQSYLTLLCDLHHWTGLHGITLF